MAVRVVVVVEPDRALVAENAELRRELAALKVPRRPAPTDADIAFLRWARARHGDAAMMAEPFLARTLFKDAKAAGQHFARLQDHAVDGVVVRKVGEIDGTALWMLEPAGDPGSP